MDNEEKKERIKKFDENLVIVLAAIGMIAVFLITLLAIFKITIIAIILLLVSPFISLLILIKGVDIYSPRDSTNIILGLGILCIFTLMAVSYGNGKHEAYLNKWIYGGSVEKERRFVEGDGAETVNHYENYYVYEPQRGKNNLPSDFIHYFLLIISWGAPIAHWFLFTASSKKYNKDKIK